MIKSFEAQIRNCCKNQFFFTSWKNHWSKRLSSNRKPHDTD